MKKILFTVAIFISLQSFAQKAAKDTSTKGVLMDSLCSCFAQRDLSGVKDMQGFQTEFTKCFMQPASMGLFMKLATERGVDMSDEESGRALGAEIGKEMFGKCETLKTLIDKMLKNQSMPQKK